MGGIGGAGVLAGGIGGAVVLEGGMGGGVDGMVLVGELDVVRRAAGPRPPRPPRSEPRPGRGNWSENLVVISEAADVSLR